MASQGQKLLKGRYSLTRLVNRASQSEVWIAHDQDGGQVLLKLWAYQGERPNEVVRALWDRELRNLFRLSSSPDAEARLLVLRDAGVDSENKCFAMLLAAPGYETLESVLETRARCDWLRDLRTVDARLPLWRAARNLALGLTHLHDQQMLHRTLSADAVYLDTAVGPETMRLGGFEWTVRIGQPALGSPTPVVPTAPEQIAGSSLTQTFESDWYQFGTVLARIFSGVSRDIVVDPARHDDLITKVQETQKITGAERELLMSLLERSPERRLSRGAEVIADIDNIIFTLDQPARIAEDSYLALAVLLGPNRYLTEAICEIDSKLQPLDTESQRTFIQADLEAPRIVALGSADRKAFLLQGNRLVYLIKEYSEPDEQPSGQWNLAFSDRPYEIRYATGDNDQIQLTRLPVRVFRLPDVKRDPSIVQRGAFSWRTLLPRVERFAKAREAQEKLHEFFRVTNQLELLFRDAEVFPYRVVQFKQGSGVQKVVIAETSIGRPIVNFARIRDGMTGFLQLQKAEKRFGDLVYLGPEECVRMDRQVPKPEFWEIVDIDEEHSEVKLKRVGVNLPKPPSDGFLRCFEMFGQISLVRRRQRAIDRLRNHGYLLKALRTPGLVYIDTGDSVLPVAVEEKTIDEAKRHALHNIWRTRPIFALQGPPGTGKTTLVAHLLGQIFADDPVAQVLVTAQAHSAVDVLRDKVSRDIFREGAYENNQPLAIRLTRAGDFGENEPDSIHNVTLRILNAAEQQVSTDSALGREWVEVIKKANLALRRNEPGPASDMAELVKRSANIVYSTTTAGDLEELADLTQSFDWSLIEESGKAHGFDLALPLQTGHRWLLIGDQNQLPPYRFNDFRDGLLSLDSVMDALMHLPDRAGGLVDIDLVHQWRALSDTEKDERRTLWLNWLPVFAQLHRNCSEAVQEESGPHASGVLASMLWQQHRMHPTIAGLISAAYYDRPIESMTVDQHKKPLPRVVHPFVSPASIEGAQIIWIDVGWHQPVKPGASEDAPPIDHRETSLVEAETIRRFIRALQPRHSTDRKLRLAVLSPYRRQVLKLSSELRDIYSSAPSWLLPLDEGETPAYTVDSFQGNQADVVIVSLVRQNRKPPGEGLGFLKESSRMNVLFSRAESMLVLVGSWDFFQYQLRQAPKDRNQPLGHWKLAIDYVEQSIRNGNALLLSGRTFKEEKL
jgi:hypothetical protein